MTVNNPYQAPVAQHINPVDHLNRTRSIWMCWFRAWLAIGFSGVLFGMIGGPFGMFVGGVIAFPVSLIITAVVFYVVSLITKDGLTMWQAVFWGAACGFLSGVASVGVLTADGITDVALIAGVVGAMGGAVGNLWLPT